MAKQAIQFNAASDAGYLVDTERALRAAKLFLAPADRFSLSIALYGHSVRRDHWITRLAAELQNLRVHLEVLDISKMAETSLLGAIEGYWRNATASNDFGRVVTVIGLESHLPVIAENPSIARISTPFLAQANLDRELFPSHCPFPLLLWLTPTAHGQFRRQAPDLSQWCSHVFDFQEISMPDGSGILRSMLDYNHSGPGTIYHNRDDLLRAEHVFREGMDVGIRAHGDAHSATCQARANLINVLHQLGRFSEALGLAEVNLSYREENRQADPAMFVSSLLQLAIISETLGDYSRAEAVMRQALIIAETDLGIANHGTAAALNNLAQLLQATNRLAEAEPLMRRALSIDEAYFGKDHPSVATGLNNLALLLQTTNRFGEAESLMRRALAIDESFYGEDHPQVATNLNNFAALLQTTNRLSEAEPLIRRALVIDEAAFGNNHPDVARDLTNLAQLLLRTNRLEEAEPLIRRALAIDENSFGKDHPRVASHLNGLAQLLKAANRLAEAEPHMRRALAIHEATFGKDHPDVAIDLNNLVGLLHATERLAESEPLARRMVAILLKFTAATGHFHSHLIKILRNYGIFCRDMDMPENDFFERLFAMCAEAGLDKGFTQQLLKQAFDQ